MSVCLITSCLSQSVFATNNDKEKISDIDQIYAEAYTKAITNTPVAVNSDESAYSYLISHLDLVQLEDDGTISVQSQNMALSQEEKNIFLSFIKKLNTLVQLNAVSLDSNLQLHFVFTPAGTPKPIRLPVASILSEARNHAVELKNVYDNAVFTPKSLTAGIYFAERVKSGGIWDYKSYMGTNTMYYMEDLRTNMSGESIGNFHYGYVGRAVFSATTLKSAAGMYQIISGTSSLKYWDSFFDDPSDQYDIERGISYYESEH